MPERRDLPLIAWGEALRAARLVRERRQLRLAFGALGIAALGLTIAVPPTPRLVWNASASAPRGLYVVSPGVPIAAGDMVVARTPDPWRMLAAKRHYLPANVPLVKRVVAGPGDLICAQGADVAINSVPAVARAAPKGAFCHGGRAASGLARMTRSSSWRPRMRRSTGVISG